MSRRFVLLALVLFAGVLATRLGGVLYARFGEEPVGDFLEAMTAEESASGIERWRVEEIHDEIAARLDTRLAFLLWSFAIFVALFARWLRRGRRSETSIRLGLCCGSFLFAYLALELLVAPFLVTRLGLYNYFFVLDVDHLLPASHRGIGTNRDRLRTPRERGDLRSEDFNILFLGDSFTFGLGVESEEAFPTLVEERLDARFPSLSVRTVNFGWTSASPILAWRRLRDLGEAYRPDFVVYCFDMSDFHDEIKYRNMLERRGIYWFYDKVPLALKLLETLAPPLFERIYRASNANLPAERFFMSEAPLAETRRSLEPALDGIDRLADWSRDRDLGFALIVLPRSYQYSTRECPENREAEFYTVLGPHSLEPFRFFDEVATTVDHPVFSLLDTFRSTTVFPTCFRDDPHWNPAGHELAAAAIADLLAPLLERRLGADSGSPPESRPRDPP